MDDDFYLAFEARYRGSREVIKDRLKAYLPFVLPLVAQSKSPLVLDLGCGRGEWLELMKSEGVEATGVDVSASMVQACAAQGLAATEGDAKEVLTTCPADSLDVVTAFHLAEHLSFDELRQLVKEAFRAIRPGGLLILETPNPENLTVGACQFHLDPSHKAPLPPALLSFVAEYAGFDRVKIGRTQEEPALRTAPNATLLDVLSGASPDYAVIAQKAIGTGTQPDIVDEAFQQKLGLTLPELAHRFQQVVDAVPPLVARVALNEQKTDMSQKKIEALESSLEEHRLELHAAEEELNAIYSSFLWRLASPFRSFTERAKKRKTS